MKTIKLIMGIVFFSFISTMAFSQGAGDSHDAREAMKAKAKARVAPTKVKTYYTVTYYKDGSRSETRTTKGYSQTYFYDANGARSNGTATSSSPQDIKATHLKMEREARSSKEVNGVKVSSFYEN